MGAVVSAMRGLVTHEELQFKGAIILGLATNSEIAVNLLLRAPSLGTIVSAMDAWPDSEDVIREGFVTLAAMTSWSISKRQVMHEGVFGQFRMWAEAHLDNEDVIAPACSLIGNVSDDDVVCADLVSKGLGTFVLTSLEKFSDNFAVI